MNKTNFQFFFIAILFIIGFSLTHPALAHGDEPRLEISSDRMNPGGVVDVRGVDFEREEAITLMLVNAQTAIPLGEIFADVEGVFLQTVVLPVELAEGTYNFLAITEDHNITSPDLTVQGPAVVADGEGGQGLRDEDDPLLAPMPTFAPAVVTAPVAAVPVEARPASASNRNILFLIVLTVIGMAIVAIVFAINATKRKNTQ